MRSRSFFLIALAPIACGRPSGDAACGFTSVAGSSVLLSQFAIPHQTLGGPPAQLPGKLVVRVVAGPAYPAVIGKVGNDWVAGMEGVLPPKVTPGFGVLVLDPAGRARGVVLYESEPVRGAPRIGSVAIGARMVPLIGIQLDPARFEDPRCPFFPDSVIQ